MPLSVQDPTSFSRPDHHRIQHIHMVWEVDFEKKVLKGKAQYKIEKQPNGKKDLILDVARLAILNIYILNGNSLNFKIDEHVKDVGSKLTIELPPLLNECFDLVIKYETTSETSGLQWLEPLQTAGQTHPYVFSQFQAIHARSVIPCQDTPAVKFTYSAEVTASKEFTVLMSALRTGKINYNGVAIIYSFNQPIPIPSYLIAIAVGVLASRELGPRSTVWAEKEIIEKCAWEFADTDRMLRVAEELCGPYVWGIYDLLVLPPSFPYGGMENPCLTFVTPTLLAGDRSLADVVAHEISHSWTGNLVTNKNFEHFWLNEGFTVFVERKITSRLAGETRLDTKYRDFTTILGLTELKETVEDIGKENPLTKLVVNLKGLNPDDAFSKVPYEKGSTFLRYLENLLGGPVEFEPFLRHYLDTFKMKSIDTDDFKNNLEEYFKDKDELNQIEWEKWLYTPGMPLHIPNYDATLLESCTALIKRWTAANVNYSVFDISDIKDMNSLQQLQFLSELHVENITLDLAKALERAYSFNETNNAEIKCWWLRICIKARWYDKIKDALQFVNDQGRMKFVRPIYRDLYAWEDARQQTIDNFNAHKKYMMHLSVYVVKKDLHLR